MKKFFKNSICLIMIVLFLSFPITAFAVKGYTIADIKRITDNIIDWEKNIYSINGDNLFDGDFIKKAGDSSADWFATSISRLGYSDSYNEYSTALKNYIVNKYNTNDDLKDMKTTEYCRISLTLLSLGDDPANIKCYDKSINLIADGIYNKSVDEIGRQGVNGYIWALITLDSINYKIPPSAKVSREDIINKILLSYLSDGCFTFDGSAPNIDITAMAIQSLAPYYESNRKYKVNNENMTVKTVVDNSLSALSKLQADDGSFTKEFGVEGMAQTVIALCTMGIDPENDSRFIKNGNTLLDAILKYKSDDGGFSNTLDDVSTSNSMSSYQVLLALTSYCRLKNSCLPIYNLDDIKDGKINNIFANTEEYKKQLDKKVESINKEIKNKLYPFDNITRSDKETVNSIINEIDNTKGIDKSKILGYEQLIECKKQLDNDNGMIYFVIAGVFVFLAVAVVFIIIKVKKSKKIKEHSL